MKKLSNLLMVTLAALGLAGAASAGDARLQVIHNAADPAVEVVDIYINGELTLDDFAFRTATPFLTVPAEVDLNIGVAPGTSGSADDIIATIPVALESDRRYIAIANGVLAPGSFTGNPDGADIGFNLFPYDRARENARRWWLVDIMAFHGATDAPAVDIRLDGTDWGPLFGDLAYGEYSGYRSFRARSYTLNVTPAGDAGTVVASFEADLSGLRGKAAVVFASGFLGDGQGADFGLFAALPNGQVVMLPRLDSSPMARLQVIHNAADRAAEVVDIYVNGELTLDNFSFRTATPFIDVPAGVTLEIGVAPSTSASVAEALAVIPVTLENKKSYVAIANGVLDPGSFEDNPDGRSIGFSLFAVDDAREKSFWPWFVTLRTFHGGTDAPAVDVRVRFGWWSWKLFDDVAYGDFSQYRIVPPGNYTLDITPAGSYANVVASFQADLSGLAGSSAVVFASGFLSPDNDQGGEGFGLFAALPNGTVVPLPAATPPAHRLAEQAPLPNQPWLGQNYPNPFNPTTTISFNLSSAGDVKLEVFNTIGQRVRTLVDGPMQAGLNEISFEAGDMASGVYFYRLRTDDYNDVKKMILLK